MQCPRCQHENPDSVKFCGECGARIELICPDCQSANPASNKFCHECGAALGARPPSIAAAEPQAYTPTYLAEQILSSRAALEGERKQVTVLFADLKSSMELLADRDPEEAREILDSVLERMMEAVHRYEGTVNQVMGDGIMALFGAPIAHEDHAVRACYAALQMQTAVKEYAAEVWRSRGVPLQIRVGLNSGEVAVRSIGSDLKMDYSAVGTTTNLAARMEQLATPDSILLTPHTLELVEGFVQVGPLGEISVKGLSEPIEVYELEGVTASRSRVQATSARGLTRFVGRETEMEALYHALEQAGAGRGQVVAVVGEPGVGKSRLVYELVRSHRTHGWLVLESGSVSYGKAIPFLPVVDLLKAYFQIEDRDTRQQVRERITGKILTLDERLKDAVAPLLSLMDALPETDPFRAMEPAQRRGQTIDAVRRLLLRESQRQPTLLVFEDLHWMDAESEAVLDALVESLPTSAILCLTNYRPEYQDRWTSKTYYARLRLDPLPPESTDELLNALLGDDPSLADLKHLLKERTEGNPFFLEESIRGLLEMGALTGVRGAYRLEHPAATIQVPATVQALLAARIDRLSAESKRLLQTAAVIGMDITFDLLQGTAQLPDDRLRSELVQLQRAEFLYESRLFPESEYTFKHALTRDVAYGSLLQPRRQALHRQVGELIEQRHGGRLPQYAETLIGHFEQAGVRDKAAMYCLMAAERAKQRFSYPAAADFCRKALSLMEGEAREELQVAALVLLGDLLSLMDERDAANEQYERAMEITTNAMERRHIANKRHHRHVVTRDGARIIAHDHGSGEDVLLLAHPMHYGLTAAQPVIEQLSQEFRIVTFDARGAGGSDPLPASYSTRDYAEDLRAIIENLAKRPVVAIGTSAGCRMVITLAALYPELVKAIVLVGPGRLSGVEQITAPPATDDELVDRVRRLISRIYTEPGTEELAEQSLGYMLRVPRQSLWKFFTGDDHAANVLDLLPQIKAPCLIMKGTLDPMGSAESLQYLIDHIPGAQFYPFEGRGHVLLATATTEFCEVLRRFLRTGLVAGPLRPAAVS